MISDNTEHRRTTYRLDPATLPVQSVGRAMELLARLAETGDRGMALRDLSREAGLKPTTVHSLLRSLQAGGFVDQEDATGRYRLGVRLLQLAGEYLRESNLIRLVEPVLERLSAETHETVQLGVLQGDRHTSVRVIPSRYPVVAAPPNVSGNRLYCTALGKALLAGLPAERAAHLLDQLQTQGFIAYGPNTLIDRAAIDAELARVRQQGYASNYEEGRPGIIGQAAAVRDFTGATVAAIGLAYPALRRTPEYDRRMIAAVCRAASEASRLLGAPDAGATGTPHRLRAPAAGVAEASRQLGTPAAGEAAGASKRGHPPTPPTTEAAMTTVAPRDARPGAPSATGPAAIAGRVAGRLAMGWPNVLSPHDHGLAIEDVWPALFFGSERIPEIQRKIQRLAWARDVFRQLRCEADGILKSPPQLPLEPPGWRHDFFSPATAEHLLFDPGDGESFVDPWDQSVYDGGGASTISPRDARRRAWVLLVHERTYRLMRSLGVLYQLTGDDRYAAWVADGMRQAVAMFRRQDFRELSRQRALYAQALYDAQVLLLLANAYDLTCSSRAYGDDDHAAIRRDIFEAGLRYQAAFLDATAPPNMMCYVSAALVTAGRVFARPDWQRLGWEHPRSGYYALLRRCLRAGPDGRFDGFWSEGTQFYHFYSVCPLVTLFEHAASERAAGRLDPAGSMPGMTWDEVEQRFAALFRAPLLMADAQLRLPCFGDLGAPKVMNLRLYRHLYEFAAGQLDGACEGRPLGTPAWHAASEPSFVHALARIYDGGTPRTSFAALAYGPDDLPEGPISPPSASSGPHVRPPDSPRAIQPSRPLCTPWRGGAGAGGEVAGSGSGGEVVTGRNPPALAWRQGASSVSLPAAGIAFLRGMLAGGKPIEVWLRAGAHGEGHDHLDKLAIGLHAAGEIIAADLGTAGYALSDHTAYCRSTFAHNTLLVDEQNQARVTRASLQCPTSTEATGIIDDAYPGVQLRRRVTLKPPCVLLEDQFASEDEHRYGWALHVYGSLAVRATPGAAGLDRETSTATGSPIGPEHALAAVASLPPLPDTGPFARFTPRRTGIAAGDLCADWRIRDGLWLRVRIISDGSFEWTAGQTPGNPIPDRRSTLYLRIPGRRRRVRSILEVHRGSPALDRTGPLDQFFTYRTPHRPEHATASI